MFGFIKNIKEKIKRKKIIIQQENKIIEIFKKAIDQQDIKHIEADIICKVIDHNYYVHIYRGNYCHIQKLSEQITMYYNKEDTVNIIVQDYLNKKIEESIRILDKERQERDFNKIKDFV